MNKLSLKRLYVFMIKRHFYTSSVNCNKGGGKLLCFTRKTKL